MEKGRNNRLLVLEISSVTDVEMHAHVDWCLYGSFLLLPLKWMQVLVVFLAGLCWKGSRFDFCWQPLFSCSLRCNLKLIMLPLHLCDRLENKGKGLRELRVRNSTQKRKHFSLNSSISLPFLRHGTLCSGILFCMYRFPYQ